MICPTCDRISCSPHRNRIMRRNMDAQAEQLQVLLEELESGRVEGCEEWLRAAIRMLRQNPVDTTKTRELTP